jgi:hypothetical protein
MEIDWIENISAIGSAIIWLFMWISMWNIVELTVKIFIDHHKNYIRSKYIVYSVMFVVAFILALVFNNSLTRTL